VGGGIVSSETITPTLTDGTPLTDGMFIRRSDDVLYTFLCDTETDRISVMRVGYYSDDIGGKRYYASVRPITQVSISGLLKEPLTKPTNMQEIRRGLIEDLLEEVGQYGNKGLVWALDGSIRQLERGVK
jgi:hypothetical protein